MRKYYKHNELKYEILKYLEKHPGATVKEISEATGANRKSLEATFCRWCSYKHTYVMREWTVINGCGMYRYYLSDRGRFILSMLKKADKLRKMGLKEDLKLKKPTVP